MIQCFTIWITILCSNNRQCYWRIIIFWFSSEEQLKTIFPDSLVLLEDKIENEEIQLDSHVCKVYDIENGENVPCRKYIVVCWADEESEAKINKKLESLYADLDKASQKVKEITKRIDETKFKIYKKL